MKKLRMTIELTYDDGLICGKTEEGKRWFYDEILGGKGDLILHSNEIGDSIGEVRVLELKA